jgi:hypothetical protein
MGQIDLLLSAETILGFRSPEEFASYLLVLTEELRVCRAECEAQKILLKEFWICQTKAL